MTIHGSIASVSCIILFAIHGASFFVVTSFQKFLVALALGAGVGVIVQLAQLLLKQFIPALRRLSNYLSIQFEGWTFQEIFFVSLISSISEELLFRAVLQPYLGLWFTSILFGAAHWTGQRELRIWVLFAFAAGVLLGMMAEHPLFGLPGCIAAHYVINLTSLWILTRKPMNSSSSPDQA